MPGPENGGIDGSTFRADDPEVAPETGVEPFVRLTDDEAVYASGTLGSTDETSASDGVLQETDDSDGYESGLPVLPRHQGRKAWSSELSGLLSEARRRGDNRPGLTIVNEWLSFRGKHQTEG